MCWRCKYRWDRGAYYLSEKNKEYTTKQNIVINLTKYIDNFLTMWYY